VSEPVPRWRHRFDNYKRAFVQLSAAVDLANERELSDLEEEGVIQRFEYTWELAWKLLADVLENEGVVLDPKTPKAVLRAALTAKLIDDGETWMDALDARNRMSHTYDIEEFEAVVREIQERYFDLFASLHATGLEREASQP
jgi:nucleotidyltransferase substrate binding protein (TIGR01987 family)